MSPSDGGDRPRWLVAVTEYAGLTGYTGGIGRHYASLLPALVRAGVDVDLLVFSSGPQLTDADLEGVSLVGYRVESGPRLVTLFRRAMAVRRRAARGYDAVFVPEWTGAAALVRAGTPLITNLATSTRVANRIAGFRARDFGLVGGAVSVVQSALEDRQIRRSRGVIPISRAMEEINRSLLGRLPPARIVRNCIDAERVADASIKAPLPPAYPEAGPAVLFLGRLERRKGVLTAVDAFARLTVPGTTLVLAGSSGDSRFEPDRAALLARVPAQRRGDVVFLGHVADDSLYAAVRAADVVVCPSLWEGFGQVALEVGAIGTPLVVTTGSGYDDFCTDGVDSLMVAPGDDAALAAAVTRLLTEPGLGDRLAAAGIARAPRYTADAVAPDLVSAVQELLASPRRPNG